MPGAPARFLAARERQPRMTETTLASAAIRARAAAAILALVACLAPVRAQTPEEFYKGRAMTMLAFSPAGSTYDNYARALARHMGNFIPGKPTFIVQNMVGAGGLKLVDYLYRIAPKDGSVMGTIGRGLAFEPMLGRNEVSLNGSKFTSLRPSIGSNARPRPIVPMTEPSFGAMR